MNDYQTLNDIRRLFKLLNINVKLRRIPKSDDVKIYGDINHELVKPYITGELRVIDGGDFINIIT